MSVALLNAPRFALMSFLCSTLVLSACGTVGGKESKKSSRSEGERLSGDLLKDDCLKLGNTPGQNPNYPGQNPNYPGQKPNIPYVPSNPYDKGDEPVIIIEPPVTEPPALPPPQNPCLPYERPTIPGKTPPVAIDPNDPGHEPIPFPPTQQPYDPDTCGKNGKYCDDGGPGQWPGQTVAGGQYDQGVIDSCLGAFRSQGYDTQGQWTIDVREINNVSVLSRKTIRDQGTARSIVLINSVSVLSGLHYELLNPNALYCIQSVSVLERVRVTSCHTSNIVFGSEVNVLSRVNAQTVDCQY